MNGTLYGLGVGPGDPELITLKSWRILSMAEVVAYPVAPSGTTRARDVASHFIPEDVIELPLEIPFGCGEAETSPAYDSAAQSISEHLSAGRNVAFLCMVPWRWCPVSPLPCPAPQRCNARWHVGPRY